MTCLPAARRATERPVSVDPTKPTPAVSGWPAISSPTIEPGPVTRLIAPAGRAASARHSISFTEMAEVEVAGAHTIGFPPASAGASHPVAIVSGQFQGVISA